MSKGSKRRPGTNYDTNYPFQAGEVQRGSWVFDSALGKLVPKDEYNPPIEHTVYIHGDIESFVSPITKEVISDRKRLRIHNREHGVTNSADYSKDFLMKRSLARNAEMTGSTKSAQAERREMLSNALKKEGI